MSKTISKKTQIGARFGLVVVEKNIGKRNGITQWLCRCDCGGTRTTRATYLNNGRVRCCGCKRRRDSTISRIVHEYKNGARIRGISWSLTKEDVEKLAFAECFYCGVRPKRSHERTGIFVSGIDRIDNRKGYFIENVVTACTYCNRGKMDKTKEDFLAWVKRVYEHTFA